MEGKRGKKERKRGDGHRGLEGVNIGKQEGNG